MPTMTKSAAKSRTKSQIVGALADETGLTRKEVSSVFEALSYLIKKDLGRRGPGIFNVLGMKKIRRVHKPATKARRGVNPFTGQEMMFKAKPARSVVKVTALKALKDMV